MSPASVEARFGGTAPRRRTLFMGFDYLRIEEPVIHDPEIPTLTFEKQEQWFRYDQIMSVEADGSTITLRFVSDAEPLDVPTRSHDEAERAATLFRERAAAARKSTT